MQAHTAPFNNAQSWGGKLPRIPDGAEECTQIQQIRFQSNITTDSNGNFHIIVPGDPFQHRFPIIDHTMFGTSGTGPVTIDPLGWSASGLVGTIIGDVATPAGAAADATSAVEQMRLILSQVAAQYGTTGPYAGYIEQLYDMYQKNSKYRIIGQGTRIWSLYGEVSTTQGIIRGATLEPTALECNYETRGDIGGRYVDQFQVNGGTNAVTDIKSGFCPFPGLLSESADPFTDSNYGSLIANMTQSPAVYAGYLKNATEAAEHSFSYKLFPGQDGVTGRSKYTRPDIPFQRLRPRFLLYPDSLLNPVPGDIANVYKVAQTPDGHVGILNLYTSGDSSTSGSFSMLVKYDDVVGAGQGGYLQDGLVIESGSGELNFCTGQTTCFVGMDEALTGTVPAADVPQHYVTGYHFEGTNFVPNTQLLFEHVLTVEVVPIAQQTGVMSIDVMPDPEFHKILEIISDDTAFPCIVKGHSFWSSLKSAFSKAVSVAGVIARGASTVAKVGSMLL